MVICGRRTSQALDLIERGSLAIAAALALAGVALMLVGRRNLGGVELLVAAVLAAFWLLIHLYRGEYRIYRES